MSKYNNDNKIKNDIMNRGYNLIKKNKILKFYKDSQLYVPIIVILSSIIYYFYTSKNYNLNGAITQYEFYIAIFVVFIYIITIDKTIKQLDKEVKSEIETVRNKMILKICNCNNSCKCKEEFNTYMKKKGVKII